MKISDIINDYGREHSPYMKNLVNHLPMGQFALYKMTDDLEKVESFTIPYADRINKVKKEYPRIDKIEECIGNRDLYESCLDIVKLEIKDKGMDNFISYVLNTYPLGMSSGLFHTLIRVAYAIEGVNLEKELIDEVARALAYYITAYREAGLLSRKIHGSHIIKEMAYLMNNKEIQETLQSRDSLGQKMKALYEDERFLEKGFIIKGSEKEKVEALLDLLLPTYDNTDSIVVLHCITGLHALLVLKEYYKNFDNALDIMTTCILTHLLTVEDLNIDRNEKKNIDMDWEEIFKMASKSSDVHTLKFTYTCSELDKLYENIGLKQSSLNRIRKH